MPTSYRRGGPFSALGARLTAIIRFSLKTPVEPDRVQKRSPTHTRGQKTAEMFGLSKKVRIFAVPFDARMAELVDALLSGGSVRKDVSVRL